MKDQKTEISVFGGQSVNKADIIRFAELSAIYIYSICFSTIKSCRYWDNSTRYAIVENGLLFYESLNIENNITREDFPQKLSILDAEVDMVYVHNKTTGRII